MPQNFENVNKSAEYSCYQCVSTNDNEGDCDESDLDKLEPFNKPCLPLEEGTFKGLEAKGCRKIVQTVETKKSIIRECAYSGEVVDGQKKTGNWAINMYYYQCENSDRYLEVVLLHVLELHLYFLEEDF
ncbi:hypothetical protein OESDEN_01140 [Oesophagostomum dentatum]|uniref:Protein quiver n=1 Tax=Oesophagostomum dentatum TaxID=61180 RepID=A0A0B1TRX9_OESDE|nr:hypothetical protein OESDEN_01140 [Oesophagostomum dentatum]